MKNFTIVLFMLFFSLAASAQFNKGRMLLGGTGSFSSSTGKVETAGNTTINGKSTTIFLTPQYGYFVIDNLVAGVGVDFSISMYNQEDDGFSDYVATAFQVRPFVRYYIKPGIFFQGTYGVGSQKINFTDQSELNVRTSGWSLAGGYAIFLNDHVAIEPSLGYDWGSNKYEATDTQAERNYKNSGLFVRIGLQFYLGKKQ